MTAAVIVRCPRLGAIREAKKQSAAGETQRSIASSYNDHHATISRLTT